ncbi:COR domain-containing protein [Gloeocapsa sp. PCC 73106]|uniref:COR domain-containing protein n=1 Tax=Gloeocapsa sp. PCC 73106 TaxID=102232 RepID=UPI0002ACA572|nr:COR domain-containing protein [Gloeocapsa sp. PCC 73106]ELR98362.1 Leucine Rich Repeat (LRR)-containing protein [Gloeocapsa sp. PCC 73106]
MTEEEVLQAIAQAKQTRSVDFTINGEQLTELPPAIGELTQITKLNLKDNKLTALPSEIGKLTKLKRLYLSHNKLTVIPPEIAQLQELKIIYAGNNKLTAIPPEIAQLQQLKGLYLGDNSITSIPSELQELNNLKNLDLRKNPLPIPNEILEKVHQPLSIIKYYLEYQTAESEHLNEAKVILIGSQGVGKTSIARKLLGKEYLHDYIPTMGLETNIWKHDQLTVNLWDFGATPNMHSVYQCGFSRKCVYLLVTDIVQKAQALEYWLNMITSVAKYAPIIIVVNKIDQGIWNLDRSALVKKYPSVKAFSEISGASNEGVDYLKIAIMQQMKELNLLESLITPNSLAVKEKIATLETPYLPYPEYTRLCQNEVIQETTEQLDLVHLLENIGVIIFKEEHLIKPEWLVNNLAQIFNNTSFQQATQGIVNPNQIQQLLQLPNLEQSRLLIQVIQSLELGYLTETKDNLIIPYLLTEVDPVTDNWDEALTVQYKYNELLPQILSRLTVRMQKYIDQQLYWRHGIVLTSRGDKAIVKANPLAKTITIAVKGKAETKLDFFKAICNQLEKVNLATPGVKAAQQQPEREQEQIPETPALETPTEEEIVSPPRKKKLNPWFIYLGLFVVVLVLIIALTR